MTSKEQGFSLIEVLMAVALLGAGIVIIVGLIPTGYLNVVEAGRVSIMTQIAYREIDDLKLKASTNWTVETGTGGALENGDHHTNPDTVTGYDDVFTMSYHVDDGPKMRSITDPTSTTWDSIGSDFKIVTVTVGYKYKNPDGTAFDNAAANDQIARVFRTYVASNK